MNLSSRLLKKLATKFLRRKYSTPGSGVFKEQLTVQTFCDIYVSVPYNVSIQPLDVHQYHNYDKLDLELVGLPNNRTNKIKHIQDGNNIKIFSSMQDFDSNITCNIHAPLKANLNVTAHGNIATGFCNGNKLVLKSTRGSIFVEKYQGGQIDLTTNVGNITLKGAVIAANINAQVISHGNIKTRRIQGNHAHLRTNRGNISVDASYCGVGVFESRYGNLDLQNLHKVNRVHMEQGSLSLNGLDGQLDAELSNTHADIQIVRLLEDSKIFMKNSGDLKLRLSEECQENTQFEIISKSQVLDPAIKLIPSKTDDVLYLTPTADEFKHILVNCEHGAVQLQSASWMKMLKLNVK